LSTAVAVVATAAGLTLLPLAAQEGGARPHDPQWTAPSEDAGKVNPLAGRPETTAGGRKVFGERCATCHGETGQGTAKAPDLTQPAVQAQTDGELFWKISSGNTRSGMPSFSFLPGPQRWQLVLHLRAASAPGSPKP
jgi:mono/diheme cytochrome c family protein